MDRLREIRCDQRTANDFVEGLPRFIAFQVFENQPATGVWLGVIHIDGYGVHRVLLQNFALHSVSK